MLKDRSVLRLIRPIGNGLTIALTKSPSSKPLFFRIVAGESVRERLIEALEPLTGSQSG